jgi:hypothetical protein
MPGPGTLSYTHLAASQVRLAKILAVLECVAMLLAGLACRDAVALLLHLWGAPGKRLGHSARRRGQGTHEVHRIFIILDGSRNARSCLAALTSREKRRLEHIVDAAGIRGCAGGTQSTEEFTIIRPCACGSVLVLALFCRTLGICPPLGVCV